VTKRLIVNADDLGLSAGVNRGIFEAHDRGIVTSASLMVLQPAAAEAAGAARVRSRLSVGLHVDMAEWIYVHDEWRPVYERAPPADVSAVRDLLQRQLGLFKDLMGTEPTHLDSHQHAHQREPLRSLLLNAGSELGVPVRHEGPARYCGDFYGQTFNGSPLPEAITVEHFCRLLGGLEEGITELACHPGYADDVVTSYSEERAREIEVLGDPRVRRELESLGVRLCSFADIVGAPA
jgi:predicted glycoside hydrolase/deacetylase ChbG (UPF0249 family)